MLGKLLATAGVDAGATKAQTFKTITFMGNSYPVAESFSFLQTLFNIISYAIIPLFIAVAAGGAIYAIVLGVNLARAADAETRDAAKKRLIWAIVGLASIIVLIILLNWLMPQIPKWVSSYADGDIWEVTENNVTKKYKWNSTTDSWEETSALLVF